MTMARALGLVCVLAAAADAQTTRPGGCSDQAFTSVTATCCSRVAPCGPGQLVPRSCSRQCAAAFIPLWTSCGQSLAAADTTGELTRFASTCGALVQAAAGGTYGPPMIGYCQGAGGASHWRDCHFDDTPVYRD